MDRLQRELLGVITETVGGAIPFSKRYELARASATRLTTEILIEELKGRAEAYGFQRSALGSPGIEFWFLKETWDYEEAGTLSRGLDRSGDRHLQ